jgi:hypothetical protein
VKLEGIFAFSWKFGGRLTKMGARRHARKIMAASNRPSMADSFQGSQFEFQNGSPRLAMRARK